MYPATFLGIIAPLKSGVTWTNNLDGLHEPCEAQVEGIYLPLNQTLSSCDLYALDGYFTSRPKSHIGNYDPEVVEQFLSINKCLPFEALSKCSPFPLYPGWIPVRCKADPGDPLLGLFYEKIVILVYSNWIPR